MSLLHGDGVLFVARILLVALFPFSALDKVLHWDDAMAQCRSSFLPAAPAMLIAAMAVEATTPACIVLGWHAVPAALLLAAFCVVTALLYHPFWQRGDFWAKRASVDRAQFWDFLKNLGLAGGLLLVATGAGFAVSS